MVIEELQLQVPDWQECMIDSLPSPPSAIIGDGITVFNFSAIGNRLNLLMAWGAPSVTYGSVVGYEVHVTREPLPVPTSTLATVHVFRAEVRMPCKGRPVSYCRRSLTHWLLKRLGQIQELGRYKH